MGGIAKLFRKHTVGGKLGLFGEEEEKEESFTPLQLERQGKERRRRQGARASTILSSPLDATTTRRVGARTLSGL